MKKKFTENFMMYLDPNRIKQDWQQGSQPVKGKGNLLMSDIEGLKERWGTKKMKEIKGFTFSDLKT